MDLPVIDFATPDSGAEIDAGFANIGFLQLKNIGVPRDLLEQVFAASDAFFRLPASAKAACGYRSAAENFGYQAVGNENLDPTAPADLKETFTMRNIVAAPPPLDRWPSRAFRDLMQRFYAETLRAAHAVQRALAHELGVPEPFFADAHGGPNNTLRLLHYPASTDVPATPDQIGAGAHTDYGFMTLLFQHRVAGLQVRGSHDAWIDVPPLDDAVVVNCGDLLEQWTNGRYRSTLHRVRRTGDQGRLSIAMFIDPDSDTLVEALPSCVSAANPARYPPVTAGVHLQSKIDASHKGRYAG